MTGRTALQGEQLGDQISGKAQEIVGVARDALGARGEPLTDKARRFARERPWAIAALAGVLGLALFNTLRGER